ncbi:MAG: DUF6794 domain-containing protein [Saprospiraceae bacterium]
MNKYIFTFCLLICLNTTLVQGQEKKQALVNNDSTYLENIKKSKLYGVYIPRDIDDALKKLMELTTEEARTPLKAIDEVQMAKKLFFGLGRWMEYNWNFAEGSRFSHYLRQKGLSYTEDMTTCMLILFHRQILQTPLQSDVLIAKIIEERNKKIEAERAKMPVISIETKPPIKNN